MHWKLSVTLIREKSKVNSLKICNIIAFGVSREATAGVKVVKEQVLHDPYFKRFHRPFH